MIAIILSTLGGDDLTPLLASSTLPWRPSRPEASLSRDESSWEKDSERLLANLVSGVCRRLVVMYLVLESVVVLPDARSSRERNGVSEKARSGHLLIVKE